MQCHAVKVPVKAPLPVECHFWPEDDGWKGVCEELSLSVHGSSFEAPSMAASRRECPLSVPD